MRLAEAADRAQKRTKPTSVAVATFKKFSEEHSTNLAAMIAFWAFFSIFPLLLVGVTALGWLLPPAEKHTVLTRIAEMFPLLNPSTVRSLSGSWWPLVVGGVSALWSGLSVVNALQYALNSVWEVPYHRRPGMLKRTRRSLLVVVTIGAGLVSTTLLSSFITTASNGVSLGVAGHVGGYVVAILLDVGLVVATFRVVTERAVSARDVLPGGILAGVSFFVLQELSAFIISRHLRSAQSTYGHFATVITMLWWFYVQAIVTLLGAQLNVVLKQRLFPRSAVNAPRTEADHRVLEAYAKERTYHPDEVIRTEVPKR
jgi:membrane protein